MESDFFIVFDDLTEDERRHLVVCVDRVQRAKQRLREAEAGTQSPQDAMETLCRELLEKYGSPLKRRF